MKITKRISWLEDYFYIAVAMYPSQLKKVKKIYIIPTPLDRRMTFYGLCQPYSNDTYSIGLALYYQKIIFKEKHVDVSKAMFCSLDILEAFAHELSHVITTSDHTVHHKRVEHRIMGKFLTKLLKDGYVSEEEELKLRKRW